MCINCGLGLTLPIRTINGQEEEHIHLYSKDTYIANYLKNYAPYTKNAYKRGLERLGKYAPPGAMLLDVGCGFGYFLNLAREAGYAVKGIEVSRALAREGKDRLNITIQPGSILEIGEKQSVDVLTAWDMLEHVIDVDEVLRRFWECLKPGGLLLLRVPDFSFRRMDLPADFLENYTKDIYPLNLNEHYHHFSQRSLEMFIRRAGFKVLEWWFSQDDEYTPRDLPDYAEFLKQMKQYGIACEIHLIAKRIDFEEIAL
jgi:2-polyprenyl-3-methyl-5-hydroxy-6-metoxy-1,4-benzoquinol methylase